MNGVNVGVDLNHFRSYTFETLMKRLKYQAIYNKDMQLFGHSYAPSGYNYLNEHPETVKSLQRTEKRQYDPIGDYIPYYADMKTRKALEEMKSDGGES